MVFFMIFFLYITLLIKNEFVIAEPIVDGSDASKGEFRFQVSFQKLSKNNSHYCSGSIVHEQFVLTAAHCVLSQIGSPNDIRIIAGIVDLRKATERKNIRRVAEIIRNPFYNYPLPKENDIALVKVDIPFEFDTFIGKIELAPNNFQIPDDQIVYVTGWGLEKATATSPPNNLKKTKVYVIDSELCLQKYHKILIVNKNSVFCTLHKNAIFNEGVCSGDSGGPVTVNKNILVGVIKGSYHGTPIHPIKPECGSKTYPDMHSDVSKYRDWIDRTIAAHRT